MKKYIAIFLLFYLFSISYAQKWEAIDINSNRMEMESSKNLITFYDDVVVKRGDLTLHSSVLKVYYKEEGKEKKRDVDYIIAEGNVKIIQGIRTATGDEARFYKDKDIIILTGNPSVVREGESEITGNKVTIYLKENKSVIEGSRPRVIFKMGD